MLFDWSTASATKFKIFKILLLDLDIGVSKYSVWSTTWYITLEVKVHAPPKSLLFSDNIHFS